VSLNRKRWCAAVLSSSKTPSHVGLQRGISDKTIGLKILSTNDLGISQIYALTPIYCELQQYSQSAFQGAETAQSSTSRGSRVKHESVKLCGLLRRRSSFFGA
jgi:hypothetical protein